MNAPFQIRQLASYPRQDAAIPGTFLLVQLGEAGSPYGSIAAADLVASALGAGGVFQINASTGSIVFGDGPTNAGVLSMTAGDFLFSAPIRAPSANLTFVNTSGVLVNGDPVVTATQLAAVAANTVTSFNFRQGEVLLEEGDILRAGGAPIRDAHFGGWITAPSHWDVRIHDDTVATANWVHRVLHSGCYSVSSFNGRRGCVTLQTSDVNAAYAVPGPPFPTASNPALGDASNRIATTLFVDESLEDLHATVTNEWNAADLYLLNLLQTQYAPINSPNFTGVPTGPTANPGTNTGELATTAFVQHAVAASTAGVSSFNTRTGIVTLTGADITSAGGALLNSPVFVGSPMAPTAAPGTNNTQLATTAFVDAAIAGSVSGVSSFNTRTGAVVLTLADVTGTNVLVNTALTGVPVAPTAAPGNSTTQLATTAFVSAAVSAAGGVTSFMSRTGAVTLIGADVSAAGGALTTSPIFTGVPAAPTAAPGTSTTQIATTAFVTAALAATGVTSFNGRSGAVTLTLADVTGTGGAPVASPTFTGTPAAPTATAGTNTTQLATTAFVTAAIAATGTPGFTWALSGGVSTQTATGASGAYYVASGNPSNLQVQNRNAGNILTLLDNSSNAFSPANYLVIQNAISGQPAQILTQGGDTNRSIQLVPNGTGTVQAPTMAPGTNSTAIATTAFVHAATAAPPVIRSYLAGLTLSTAGLSTTFSVSAGIATDSQNFQMMTLGTAMSKTTAAWAAGAGNGALDTGTIANSTWYHVFLIYNSATQATDIAISLSPSSPTYPSGYSFARRIGSMKTNASAQWIKFLQVGDVFELDVGVTEISGGTLAATTTATVTLSSVPTGVKVQAMLGGFFSNTAVISMFAWDPDVTGGINNYLAIVPSASGWAMFNTRLMTNASAQFTWRNNGASAHTGISLFCTGWIDRRGKDA